MSDEEKKAIEDLKEVIDLYNDECLITTEDDFKSIKILLNLIEKQSKEIEELKEKDDANLAYYDQIYQNGIYTGQKAVEEKIKAKIEEYKKQIEKMEKDDNGIGFTLGKEWSDLKAKVEFGQSLLEKE